MAKKVPAYAKNFRNHSVLIFDENHNLTRHKVYGIDNGCIETEDNILELEGSIKYYDQTNGGFTYIYNLDLPAKVEAENLKKLRRNTAINNLFKYDREKGLDIFKLMPWIITIVALIFK